MAVFDTYATRGMWRFRKLLPQNRARWGNAEIRTGALEVGGGRKNPGRRMRPLRMAVFDPIGTHRMWRFGKLPPTQTDKAKKPEGGK